MSIAVTAPSRQAGKLSELPQNHGWIYGVGSRGRKREGKKEGGREILQEVRKDGIWQNGSESKIRNRDEIRGTRMDGMDKRVAYTERMSE